MGAASARQGVGMNLGQCRLRTPGWQGRIPGLVGFGVGIAQGSPCPAHVPFDEIGEHADEEMSADPVLEAVEYGSDLEVAQFEASECTLHAGQPLVVPDAFGGGHVIGSERGADDVDSVEGGLGVDGLLLAAEAEAGRGDVDVEVLPDLFLVDDLALEGSALDTGDDLRERLFGSLEQLLPHPVAVPGKAGIAAGDEALPGEVGMVLDLEQGLLLFGVLETVEMALAGELADGPALEGGDPRDAVAFAQGLDGGLDDHAAVPDHHHPGKAEAALEAVEFGQEGLLVGDVSRVDRDRDRAPVAVAEEAEIDLREAPLAVAAVAEACERTVASLVPGRGQVPEDEIVVRDPASCQASLDALLPPIEPVHRRVEVIGGDVPGDGELLRQGGVPPPSVGGELGIRPEDAAGDHGEDKLPFRAPLAGAEAGKTDGIHGRTHRLHRPVVAGADRIPEHVADFGVLLSRQRAAQQRDGVRRQVGEIGEGSLLHPVVVVAIALSEED